MAEAIFAGSFDPITKGHMDIIARGAGLFSELHVVVLHNPEKKGCFPVEDRLAFIHKAVQGFNNIKVCTYGGFVVDYLKENNIRLILRGMRSEADFYAEQQYSLFNKALYSGAEAVFLLTDPSLMHISSTGVRQVLGFGGDVSVFLPPSICDMVTQAYNKLYGKGKAV